MYFASSMLSLYYLLLVIYSVSCQLIRQKATRLFRQLYYLIEGTVALIQCVDNIEQCSDV